MSKAMKTIKEGKHTDVFESGDNRYFLLNNAIVTEDGFRVDALRIPKEVPEHRFDGVATGIHEDIGYKFMYSFKEKFGDGNE